MFRFLSLSVIALMCTAAAVNADIVGENPLVNEGSPDGWSGISTMNGYGGLPAGQSVATVNYAADAGRADGTRHMQPLITKEEGGEHTIWEVGPAQTPDAGGIFSFDWGSAVIPDDGNTYHPAVWQWVDGSDDDNASLIPFGDGSGSGMFQSNRDGTSYVPAVGDTLDMGHASGAGGRAYQMNFETVPEPTAIFLFASALLPLLCLRRRRK